MCVCSIKVLVIIADESGAGSLPAFVSDSQRELVRNVKHPFSSNVRSDGDEN